MQLIKEINNESIRNMISCIASENYLKSYGDYYDYGYFEQNNVVLPVVFRKKLFFRYAEFTSGIIGACSLEQEKQFLNEMVKYCEENLDIDFAITSNTAIFNTYPDNSEFCKFGSYILNLDNSEDQLFTGLHSKHRNVVRKAKKDGVEIFHGIEYMNDCISVIEDTYSRQNKVFKSKKYFEYLAKHSFAEFWVAKYNGITQGGAILFSDSMKCYYMHAGSCSSPHTGSMNYLVWSAMIKKKAEGVRYFDFVGARINPEKKSKLEGIQRFKQRFGANLVEGYLFKFKINMLHYGMYRILLKIYFFIKKDKYIGDTVDQERKRGIY